MKIERLKITLSLLACALAFFGASASAVAKDYVVTINTSSLIGNANGPFSLDFQLNYGSGSFGNNVTIGNFNFGGGSATPGTATPFGTAAGDLGSVVTISDNSTNAFNEFFQGFSPGSTLSFNVTLSNNTTINTPDGFSLGILDSNLLNIPTDSPEGASQMAEFAIGGLGEVDQKIAVATFPGTGDYSGVTITVASVPEPSSWALAGVCVALFVFLRRRFVRV